MLQKLIPNSVSKTNSLRFIRQPIHINWLLPFFVFVIVLVIWDQLCVWNKIPSYILPRPYLVLKTMVTDWELLFHSLLNTLKITFISLILAIISGIALAILFTLSKPIEIAFSPYTIILQVTPLVAVFPLINIYITAYTTKLLLCAWIISFFPILSNTLLGLKSADLNLQDLYRFYHASYKQTLIGLQLPYALPFLLTGIKISGGLALIGAVVAEFLAGSSGKSSGIATRLIEAGHQLNTPRVFATITLIATSGVIVFFSISFICHLILHKWHESAINLKR